MTCQAGFLIQVNNLKTFALYIDFLGIISQPDYTFLYLHMGCDDQNI